TSILQSVLEDMHMYGNEEQELALSIVVDHFENERHCNIQMLLYLAGIGGTCKSHVIQAVVEYFDRQNAREKLLLSAPTGIAAVLISGHTLHALAFLPTENRWVEISADSAEKMNDIWRDVEYLTVDEVSMVSAQMMSHLSRRL
ncbi:hypothetical protein OF83DRAFT_1029408, partial [Amylostereum chailletii]